MIRKLVSILSLVVALAATLTITTPAQAAGGWAIRLEARMRTGTPLEAKGDYRERMVGTTLVQKFAVELRGGTPNSTYEVRVNGNLFGTITTDALGSAKIEVVTQTPDDNPHDNDPPIPQDFPRLIAGDSITVGALSGVFARR